MGEERRQREKKSGLKRRQEREERSSPLMGGGEGLREVRQRDHLAQRNVQLLNCVLFRAEDTPTRSFLVIENCCGVDHHLH